MSGPTFYGVWPVLDDELTVAQAAALAADELTLLAWEQGVVCVGPPTWRVIEGVTYPDVMPSPLGLYLTCEALARPHDGQHAPIRREIRRIRGELATRRIGSGAAAPSCEACGRYDVPEHHACYANGQTIECGCGALVPVREWDAHKIGPGTA